MFIVRFLFFSNSHIQRNAQMSSLHALMWSTCKSLCHSKSWFWYLLEILLSLLHLLMWGGDTCGAYPAYVKGQPARVSSPHLVWGVLQLGLVCPPAWQQGPLTAGPLWPALLEMLVLLLDFWMSSLLCLPVVELIKSPRWEISVHTISFLSLLSSWKMICNIFFCRKPLF